MPAKQDLDHNIAELHAGRQSRCIFFIPACPAGKRIQASQNWERQRVFLSFGSLRQQGIFAQHEGGIPQKLLL
eukprot:1140844-Pelagomonas_calceolata.AAC.5